jgi:hypothetical protein
MLIILNVRSITLFIILYFCGGWGHGSFDKSFQMALDVQNPDVNNFLNIFISMQSGRIINKLNPIWM